MRILIKGLVLSALLAMAAVAQMDTQYLDYYIVKVKPEKRADFDGLAKKIVEANRKNGADRWLTYQTEFGEGNTVYFVSPRKDMAAIESAGQAFMNALKESFGPNAESLLQDLDKCITSSRGEIRRRRWDLSMNAPKDDEGENKRIGEARWIRTMAVRVRPGRALEFEDLVRTVKAAIEKSNPGDVTTVSQSVLGQSGTSYYFSTLKPSLGSFDVKSPSLKEMLGDEGYLKYQEGVANTVVNSETMLGRFLPALSNPPEGVVNITRDFWIPKTAPVEAARAKQRKGKEKANQ